MIIKRGITTIADVQIDEKTIFTKKLMGEHKVTAQFIVNAPISFQIGDYIEFGSEKFYINRSPELKKINLKTFQYKIEFEGEIYSLYNKRFMYDGLADFDYVGTASDFVTLILSSINSISSGWTAGTIDTTDEKLISFTSDTCRSALTRIAEEFSLEFDVVGKEITMKSRIGTDTAHVFQYGKGLGFYELERKQVNDANIVTRVFGFGGKKNIPEGYRSRAKQLVFENPNRYLEANTGLYGTIEGVYTNEDIYPKRTGTITDVDLDTDTKQYFIEDTSIDFDINDNLIEGEVAKIVFKSGDLSGYEFEITNYDHTTKKIKFNPFVEADGYELPNTLNLPAIGDTYTLVNISMPQSYVDSAEIDLEAETQAYVDENSVPQVVYGLKIDQKYVKANSITLNVGDKITVTDTDLGIDGLIRTNEIKFPIINPNKITAVISDTVVYSVQERIIKQTVQNKTTTKVLDRKTAELSRRNTIRQNQLKELIFDTDGYFDPENIKPQSIETLMLSVGAKSQDFRLNSVTITPNYSSDANKLNVSAGQLIHLQIQLEGLGYVWAMSPAATFDSLTPATAYYLYAKCSQTQLTGVWELSDSKLAFDDGTDYHFLVGILFPVLDGARDYDFTYGMTYINGRIITTGKIRSIDGNNYIDLDQNKFQVGDGTNGLDWNVTAPNTLTLKGALVQSPAGTTFPVGVFRGVYNAGSPYYKGDLVTYEGSTWLYINATPSSGNTPQEGAFWTEWAAKGLPGANGEDGSAGSDSRAVNLTTVVQGFNYDIEGANPSPTDTVITATALNTTETVYYEFFKNDVSVQNTTTNTYTYSPQAAYTNMPDKIEVQIREGSDTGTILARDQITIVGLKAGSNAITIVLSNEAHTLPTTNTDVVTYTNSGTNIQVWEGVTQLAIDQNSAYSNGSFRVSAIGSGITPGAESGADGETVLTYADHSAMNADPAKVTFTITVKNSAGEEATFTKIQSLAKSVQGDNGGDGNNGVDGNYVEYRFAKNGSTTTPPALVVTDDVPAGWSTTMPALGDLEYMWMTKATKNAAGTLQEDWNTPIRTSAVDGSDGGDGNDGTSIQWKGSFGSHPSSPQNGWNYYNTTDNKSYVYWSGTWFTSSQDGLDGDDGTDGNDGQPGTDGDDGATLYLWVKYADDDSGNGLTDSPIGKSYVGMAYNKTTQTESTNPADYTWSKLRGDGAFITILTEHPYSQVSWNGADNFIGPVIEVTADITLGAVSVYADTSGSINLRILKDSNKEIIWTKTYSVVAGYNRLLIGYTLQESIGDYVLQAEQGTGVDLLRKTTGLSFPYNFGSFKITGNYSTSPYYYHFFDFEISGIGIAAPVMPNFGAFTSLVDGRYIPEGVLLTYEGSTYFCKTGHVRSSSILPTNTSYFDLLSEKGTDGTDGDDGADGNDGATGPTGPLAMGGGDYDSGKTYYGNSTRVDIVKYNSTYYVARVDAPGGSFSNIVPTNTSYWNTFGATFESVATDLLFASLAYIDNLGVKYVRTGTTGQRIEIDGANNTMKFYDSSSNVILSLDSGVVTASKLALKTAATGERVEIASSTKDFRYYNAAGVLKAKIGAGVTYDSQTESDEVRVNKYVSLTPNTISTLPVNVLWQDESGNLYFRNKNASNVKLN